MTFHSPALQKSLADVVSDYQNQQAAIGAACEGFKDAVATVKSISGIGGEYGGDPFARYQPKVEARDIESCLLKSAWKHVYRGLNIDKIASAADRKRFEQGFETPPPFTLDNIRATFGDYLQNQRFHILKGLAECFSDLDPAYKSHSKVKIGVDGLPKRVIISNVMGEFSFGSWGREKLRDTLNALEVVRGRPHLEHRQFEDMIDEARRSGEADFNGGHIKGFLNGNAHVVFDKPTLREINLALAEFYGDVLPDTPQDNVKKQASTAVAKDLQYYPTPTKVADLILSDLRLPEGARVLEPSCGCGRLIDAVKAVHSNARVLGVECDRGRTAEARAKGHDVFTANFLDTATDPVFDLIVMNPPFYGLHWQKHLEHARKFLKPAPDGQRWGGGQLICVLPASAFWDGHLGEMGLVRKDAHTRARGHLDSGWRDLPTASFAESGTNVSTGYFTCGPNVNEQ